MFNFGLGKIYWSIPNQHYFVYFNDLVHEGRYDKRGFWVLLVQHTPDDMIVLQRNY